MKKQKGTNREKSAKIHKLLTSIKNFCSEKQKLHQIDIYLFHYLYFHLNSQLDEFSEWYFGLGLNCKHYTYQEYVIVISLRSKFMTVLYKHW